MTAPRFFTKDYEIQLLDGAGRHVTLTIIGATIDEMMRSGDSFDSAQESVEGNSFGNAIDRGEIGADAWLVYRT